MKRLRSAALFQRQMCFTVEQCASALSEQSKSSPRYQETKPVPFMGPAFFCPSQETDCPFGWESNYSKSVNLRVCWADPNKPKRDIT
jgi:hypothetical protein